MATYNRGYHICLSIESVLDQSETSFELIVVGDGCTDSTQAAVKRFDSPQVVWRNLKSNTGSQSAPNNEGIKHARGAWICYIGHDDIWGRDHLERLRATIRMHPHLEFVVSGCIYHGPKGSDYASVTGIFDEADAARRYFFPPSSIAHARDVTTRIGEWRAPQSITAPVDADFLLRAANAGLAFGSTGTITVHKFAAGHRYLSYLRPSSLEQIAMLVRFRRADFSWIEEIVAMTKRDGRFMIDTYPDYSAFAPGQIYEWNRQNKGLSRPQVAPLRERIVISQRTDPRGLDWWELEGRYRWSGPNPRPKILLPF